MTLLETIGPGRRLSGYVVDKYIDKRNEEHESVVLRFDDGTAVRLWLTADCCSKSYFTDPTQFQEVVGREILDIEERLGEGFEDSDSDVVKPHFLIITTDQGHVTIDWRNESNGYYDGELMWVVE